MMDLARQNIVNRRIPTRPQVNSFRLRSGRETGGPVRNPNTNDGASLFFGLLWMVSNLLSLALGIWLATIQGGTW